ncbi:MAG: type II toxin-antitoxin system RelE/ParE family toxin [Parasulfuritortus sp.]|nr:type II toxin-antitoxin system RelE/ParE family toxin [Parasulfuritortus sp.]
MRISLSAEAKAEANEAVDWYIGKEAIYAASDFADALDHALAMLRQFPYLGGQGALSTRILPLHTFPYSLVYRIQEDTVRVIAIAHQNRRPAYWAGRL